MNNGQLVRLIFFSPKSFDQKEPCHGNSGFDLALEEPGVTESWRSGKFFNRKYALIPLAESIHAFVLCGCRMTCFPFAVFAVIGSVWPHRVLGRQIETLRVNLRLKMAHLRNEEEKGRWILQNDGNVMHWLFEVADKISSRLP